MIYEYKGLKPKIGKNVFLAPGVVVLGGVEIGDDSNLWFLRWPEGPSTESEYAAAPTFRTIACFT
jgi:carbonic anhydrase/acetyltransferase-like protein (isoleucine patch superfamily)